ncbi:MAG: hypothetical protein JEY99_10340 [Spirochaetales bacterium]|nr:hypothetical protein [Spirochaetales bacterium]
MAPKDNFDQLVHALSDTERINLLKKLESIHIDAPEIQDEAESEGSVLESVRYNLGFIEKIILFIRSLLSNKPYQKMQEDFFIEKLSKQIDKKCLSYFSIENGDFYPEFGDELLKITRSALILREMVQNTMNDKAGFISFLMGLIKPKLQSQLVKETDPYILEPSIETKDGIEIRRVVERNRERILDGFSNDDRDAVYKVIKGFYSLSSFLVYPFDQLASLLHNSLGVPRVVPMSELKPLLEHLMDRFYSFRILPEKIVLEAVYLYSNQEKSLDDEEALAGEISELADVYNSMIVAIRKFNHLIPLQKLLKVLSRDLDYTPNKIKIGGEEWFSLYRRFWENRNLKMMNKFQKERKREEMMILAASFLRKDEYPEFEFYKRGAWGGDVTVSRDLSASFIVNFIQLNFLERMNPFFKLIQNDGEFYKEQNMAEYNDAYGSLFTLQRKIREVDEAMSPNGAYGRRIQEIRDSSSADLVATHEIQKTVESAELELGKQIMDFNIKADLLINLLWGILFGEVGGRYDSLSNLGYIGGSSNDRVIMSLNNIYTEFKKFLDLLHQIQDLEK